MVDFEKRARSTGDIEPDEEVIGACNVTSSPFGVSNAGATGGLIAGGIAGGAVGAAWDARRRKNDEAGEATKVLPSVARRPAYDPGIPANGALLAVTTERLLAWNVSGLGKPRALLLSIPLLEIDEVKPKESDTKWTRGASASLLMWIGSAGRVLAMSGISMGPAGKYVRGVVHGLEEQLRGKVGRFEEQ